MSSTEQDKLRARQMTNDWAAVVATTAGRRVLMNICLDMAGTHRSVFSTNALSMAHAEGRRSLGQSIENTIEAAVPGAYATLLAERSKEADNG